ncbi:ribbon-helix-helix DNA binding domain protein [Gordonia phage VanLee]|uniref:Ribbon-helix-helix DNA binding domain protein n=1 Tax=Gordonia phage VanLee TaxID=2845816 RepID=A0A8F2DAE6_9CAUD|nr:ribbon-helix-helix DNA binding domain protein [Gordonia phage VanLee]QWS68241.1 ribbon-helix-helix DNA binding domain protein [Gordonia phage VanLee]
MAESEIHALTSELTYAVHRLIDPRLRLRSYREAGSIDLKREVHQIPSILEEVRLSLGGLEEGVSGAGTARSVPPLWMDALRWLNEIDYESRSWCRHHGITARPGARAATVLGALAAHKFRPQDERKVVNYTSHVTRWASEGVRLLGGARFGLRDTACPDCGTRTVRRQNAEGEWGTTEALEVSVEGARCLSCHRHWDASSFEHLGRILGCTPAPA